MALDPKQTPVSPRVDLDIDVHEQIAIAAVVDSCGIESGCCDTVSLRRVSGCQNTLLVRECLYSFVRSQVSNGG